MLPIATPKMERSMDLLLLLLLSSFICFHVSDSSLIPAQYDGFIYPGGGAACHDPSSPPPIVIEAFMDPLCPDCREAWAPLERALHHYSLSSSSRLSLILHPFPLPYHDNAFLACRALHIAHQLNASAAYNLLQAFFDSQESYSNFITSEMSRAYVTGDMAKFAAHVLDESLLPMFQSGFKDPKTDAAARISFKYGCSRGVTGTPYFFVNGFALPGSGSPLDYETWRSIIDPLLEKQRGGRSQEHMFDF